MNRTQSILMYGLFGLFANTSLASASIQAKIEIPGVTITKAGDPTIQGYKSCEGFKGTFERNTVWVKPSASGGSGQYDFNLIWRFGAGYRDYSVEAQFDQAVRPGRSFGISVPVLRDDIPFVQQSVLLVVRDRDTGESANTEAIFTVSRNVILSPSRDPKFSDQNCYERYPSYESTIGVLTNGSTNISSLSIKQGIDRIWGNSMGTSWGFYISPLSAIPVVGSTLGQLFTLNRNYFSMTSKQVSETVEVSTEYQLSPGDYIQIYTQKTRYISHYDATLVDACGNRTVAEGVYPMQWWGFAYHAVPVNPFDPHRASAQDIGARPVNTCSAELTPESGDSTYRFFQTNQ